MFPVNIGISCDHSTTEVSGTSLAAHLVMRVTSRVSHFSQQKNLLVSEPSPWFALCVVGFVTIVVYWAIFELVLTPQGGLACVRRPGSFGGGY